MGLPLTLCVLAREKRRRVSFFLGEKKGKISHQLSANCCVSTRSGSCQICHVLPPLFFIFFFFFFFYIRTHACTYVAI